MDSLNPLSEYSRARGGFGSPPSPVNVRPKTSSIGSLKNCGEGAAVVPSSKLIPSETLDTSRDYRLRGSAREVSWLQLFT